MPPLTRSEAEDRAGLLDVHRYTVDVDLTRSDEVFGSTTTIRFHARTPGAATFAELRPAALRRATLNGRPIDPAQLDGNRLMLTDLQADNELTVEADMRYSSTGEGLHRFCDPADGEWYVYTQGFLDNAQRVFACFDQPDLKAVFEISATAPEGWTVLSNGITTPDPARTGRWRAAATPPISTYLAAVAAGPFHSVRADHRGLPIAVHCRRSLAAHLEREAGELLDVTRRCLDHYGATFTEPFPFDAYEQAFVPELNFRAMENPGLVTLRDEYVFRSAATEAEHLWRAVVIAHEMAHMWFGNLVTMVWWDDLWLNESFAEYMGYQAATTATRFTGAWAAFSGLRKNWGYAADQRPTTHPVAPPADAVPDTASALTNVDGISYAKGASALRQLVAWLGEETFLRGVNDHLGRHRFGNAALADLLDSLARAAGDRDVHAWAEAWLRTSGVDTLRLEYPEDGLLRLVRTAGTRPHRLAIGLYDRGTDPAVLQRTHLLHADLPAGQDHIDLPHPSGVAARPLLAIPNDGDLTYCKARTDPESWAAATAALSAIPDPLSRQVLWTSARDQVRDGELPPAEYLRLVAVHLPAETEVSVAEDILAFARYTVADCYLRPDQRADALDTLTAVCRALLEAAGGDQGGLRLAALRTLIDSARTAEQARELEDWLAHGTIPGWPALDQDLRWRMVRRLCILGAASETEIGAELEHDATSTGREAAADCRAALPTAAAKRAAWQAMFTTDALSNYLMRATGRGFWQPEQHAVLAEYTTAWFDVAAETAKRRGPAIASALARQGFPAYAAERAVVAAGEHCLSRQDLLPAFARELTDRLDDLARALRVRTASGPATG